jgi:MGT family glycosyltransferase
MRSVLIAPLPEEGHLFPTFALARSLLARGYHVRYLATLDCEPILREQGFELVPLFPDLYPRGLAAAQRRMLAEARSLAAVLRALRAIADHSRQVLDRWLDGSADRLLAELDPDLVLVYALRPLLALTAYKLGIPALLVSGIVANARQAGVPPITSPLVPTGTPANRLHIAFEWRWTLAARAIRSLVMRAVGIEEPIAPTLRRLALQAGFPSERILTDTALAATVRMPELILCPEAFDFPHAPVPEVYLVEPTIDLERSRPPFPWERLDPTKTLIYCALGSQAHRSPAARRILQTVVDAVRRREDWQLVMATSEEPERLGLTAVPEGAILVPSAPQLELLARARVMLTHGGTGSLRECIHFGVPMIALAHMRDHVGNAARVVYHGLGVRRDPRKVTAQQLADDLERVLGDAAMRGRVREMQREFRRLEEARPSLEIVARYLRPGAEA